RHILHVLQAMRAAYGVVCSLFTQFADDLRIAMLAIEGLRVRNRQIPSAADIDHAALKVPGREIGTAYGASLGCLSTHLLYFACSHIQIARNNLNHATL